MTPQKETKREPRKRVNQCEFIVRVENGSALYCDDNAEPGKKILPVPQRHGDRNSKGGAPMSADTLATEAKFCMFCGRQDHTSDKHPRIPGPAPFPRFCEFCGIEAQKSVGGAIAYGKHKDGCQRLKGSADTLADRIRERAFRWITDYCNERKILHFWNRPNDITIDTLAAFALSELSAAEQAARKEEREDCAKIVESHQCSELPNRKDVRPLTKLIAAAIRNRE